MSELVINTARKNGDLPKEKDYRELTLEEAINPAVIKAYYEQYKKDYQKPSIFEKGKRSAVRKSIQFLP